MVLTTRFKYVLIVVAFLGLITFLGHGNDLLPDVKNHLNTSFRAPTADHQDTSTAHAPVDDASGASNPTAASEQYEDQSPSSKLLWQDLWDEVHEAFKTHDPVHFDDALWPSSWPTMPGYQMNKTFEREELFVASPALSAANMQNAIRMHESLKNSIPKWSKYSSLYHGKGYVMTTGSHFLNRVFPVGLQMLHKLGSELPIEIWTKDESEYTLTMPVLEGLIASYHMKITCHRFSDYIDISQFPEGYDSNFLMKAMTILMSSFEQVILLDADNVPILDPEEILSSEEYLETGLVLWPDFWSNSLSATLHTVLDIPYSFHRTCESGQVILDKKRHFESLIYANYFNWYGHRYYPLITLDGMGAGDKDTFVVGAQTAGQPFHFVTRPVELLRAAHLDGRQWREDTSVFNGAMGQFNPLNQSQVMFLHMHSPKLNLQDQEGVTTDLVFVRSDYPDVYFYPNDVTLERMLWESIAWVECDSVLRLEADPQDVCGQVKARLASM